MGSLICRKCKRGILHWVDWPTCLEADDWGTSAKMKCEACGKTTTMEKFSKRHPVREFLKKTFSHIRFRIMILHWTFKYKLWREEEK